jgi:hypothetical protein
MLRNQFKMHSRPSDLWLCDWSTFRRENLSLDPIQMADDSLEPVEFSSDIVFY